MTVQEQKTGKRKNIYLKKGLYERLMKQAGTVYVFPNRLDGKRHRTRQAVYNDIIRASKAFRMENHLSPHSLRKLYAVELLRKTGDPEQVRKDLNHSDMAISAIYFMADVLTQRQGLTEKKKKSKVNSERRK